MSVPRIVIILPLIAALIGCVNLNGPTGEGNGSETTAKGIIVDSTGVVAAGVLVQLLPATYDPLTQDTLPVRWHTLTDNKGAYRITGIAAGIYSIEAGSISARQKALIKGIQISGKKVEAAVAPAMLRKTGTVVVELSGVTPRSGDYVYLPGTNSYTMIDPHDSAAGQTVLRGVPSGVFSDLIYVNAVDSQSTNLLKNIITVPPGDTVSSAYAAWKHAKRLFLNTTVSGADITGNVYKFPILVRLSDLTFDFSQAKSNGEDIRFAKSDGSPLNYEIERWDAPGQRAEIWVKVDTIYGNNAAQYITMYWGNGGAGDNSYGPAVFDTLDNCSAVWHLNQTCNDATFANHNTVASSAMDTIGLIGSCKKFRGADSIKIAGLLGMASSITLSAWAQLDSTIPGGGSEILSIGDAVLIRMDYALGGLGTIGAIHLNGDSTFFNVTSGQFYKKTGWHFITYTVDGASRNHVLYIDGIKVSARTDTTKSIVYSGVGKDTYIGKHGNGKTDFNFFGRIDEARVYRAPVSADRVKLEYMNQKAHDALVVFKQ